MLQIVPCILHFENRIEIKQLILVLQDGLSNAKKGTLERSYQIKSERCREEFYKDSIDRLFNNFILGNQISKYKFDLPLEDNINGADRRIGVLNFENTKVRKMMDNLDKVLNSSLSRSDVRDEFSEAVLNVTEVW